IILTRVDLPAPFSPSNAWISPGRTAKVMLSLARTPGKLLVIPVNSSRYGILASNHHPRSLGGACPRNLSFPLPNVNHNFSRRQCCDHGGPFIPKALLTNG